MFIAGSAQDSLTAFAAVADAAKGYHAFIALSAGCVFLLHFTFHLVAEFRRDDSGIFAASVSGICEDSSNHVLIPYFADIVADALSVEPVRQAFIRLSGSVSALPFSDNTETETAGS